MRLTLNKIGWGVVGTLFLMTPLFAATSKEEVKTDKPSAYNWAYAEEASGLLQDIHSLSAQAAETADHLHMASRRNTISWRSHALHLNEIRTHINTMGEKFARLQEIHGMIAPWQQKAVERVKPKAVALAGHTEEAIGYVNEHRGKLWAPAYTSSVSAMSEHVDEIRNTVSVFIDYGRTSDRVRGLETQIEFPGA